MSECFSKRPDVPFYSAGVTCKPDCVFTAENEGRGVGFRLKSNRFSVLYRFSQMNSYLFYAGSRTITKIIIELLCYNIGGNSYIKSGFAAFVS